MNPKLPVGELLYAVGDIHGRADLLANLLCQIEADAAQRHAAKTTLVFLGDYVDRGPDSRAVVDLLLDGLPKSCDPQFLKGNHEALLLDFVADPRRLEHWRMNGGEATMESYGVDVAGLRAAKSPPEAWQAALTAVLPASHLAFYESLRLYVRAGDYLFVHAGIRPGVPLEAQDETDLIWIRHEFLEASEPFGAVVVHGHTPASAPVVKPNRIAIDTGAVITGRLTALRLQNGEQAFLQT